MMMQHACRLAKRWPLTASRHAARAFASFNKTSFREPDPNKPKLVLAYSGGLDTSTQLAWLVNELGYEVCAYIAGARGVQNIAIIDNGTQISRVIDCVC